MSVIFATLSLLISPNTTPIDSPTDIRVNIDALPEYVVIRSESTSSSIAIIIDHRKSKYDNALESLENHLSNKRYRNVRNQSELLTVMSELGFDYINAYPVDTEGIINVVFRKKEKYRN